MLSWRKERACARCVDKKAGAKLKERACVAQIGRQSVRTSKTVLRKGTVLSIQSGETYEVESLERLKQRIYGAQETKKRAK